ncbi:MAG TPA: hypothetical protein VJ814_10615, partial [Gaiellaceae bacterium]|nr:hypothetical protein [Gaiellaceae bacterium]
MGVRAVRRYALLAVGIACVSLLAAVTASAGGEARVRSTPGTHPLRTALFDPFLFGREQTSSALAMTHEAGARYVRLVAEWDKIAPLTRPRHAADPSERIYSWSNVDGEVVAAKAAGLTPILDVTSAPKWALSVRAHGARAGTPRASDVRAFASAIAKHYDGKHGAPAVHVFQIWNEPNVTLYLSPVSPAAYRSIVNAFAGPVHAVSRLNIVVAGDLDPFANRAKRFSTMAPLTFMRSFLCLSTCHTPVHFDVWAHHPYTFQGPFGHARRPNDVSLGDLPKMRAVLQAAARLHRVVSRRPVQFWVTEFSWDTNPPRAHAAPIKLQARWTAEALYQMWRSGVSLVTWFLLQDQPGSSPYQSGLYFSASSLASARAKPMRTSFRFPFVAYLHGGTVSVWGRDATSGKALVTIQRRHGSRGPWRTVARIRSNRS